MARASPLSPVGEIVRRHDPDRYFCTLFAPAERREALFVLYAFNHELARARETVREPFAALIRLQWWREIVEGARRRHDVAGPLGSALDAGWLDPADLLGMIDAREAETEPMETLDDFSAYIRGTAGGLMVAAGRTLGLPGPELLRDWGAAYGVAGVLRNIPALARQGRCILPRDVLAEAGVSEGKVIADPLSPALEPVQARLASLGQDWASRSVPITRETVAAALPIVLARRDLRGHLTARRGMADRAAIVWAALRGFG